MERISIGGREIAKAQRAKTPFCQRYIEFLEADMFSEIRESVVYNIVEWQWKKGLLRTDRQYQHYTGTMSTGAFAANKEAIIANKSDDKILTQMVAFKEEHSLDMCETGEQWFSYVTEGANNEAKR